ncbi:MAG: RNA polymerase sigma factor [Gemmataceae bacterium]
MTKRRANVLVEERPEANGQASTAEGLVRLFNELRDELISTLYYVLGNRDDACDAAQDAFVKCWNARGEIHKVQNLRAWIFRVCFNTAKDMQRSAWHRRSRPLKAEQYTMAAHDPAPGQTVERQETFERLRQAVHLLRQEEKEIFLLRQNGDLTYEQIAEMRGCPVGTVKTQMRSALEKLRKVLV